MRIEKKFYDSAEQECREIFEKLHREREALTEKEYEEKVRADEESFEKLKTRCEEESRKWKKEADKKKQEAFQILTDSALWLAEYMGLNIVIEQPDQFWGKIVLEAEICVFTYNSSEDVKEVLCSLIEQSSQFFISCGSGLWEMEFQYDLCREVPADQEQQQQAGYMGTHE